MEGRPETLLERDFICLQVVNLFQNKKELSFKTRTRSMRMLLTQHFPSRDTEIHLFFDTNEMSVTTDVWLVNVTLGFREML